MHVRLRWVLRVHLFDSCSQDNQASWCDFVAFGLSSCIELPVHRIAACGCKTGSFRDGGKRVAAHSLLEPLTNQFSLQHFLLHLLVSPLALPVCVWKIPFYSGWYHHHLSPPQTSSLFYKSCNTVWNFLFPSCIICRFLCVRRQGRKIKVTWSPFLPLFV